MRYRGLPYGYTTDTQLHLHLTLPPPLHHYTQTMRLVKLLEEKNIANILLGLGDTNGTYKSNPDNEINIEGLALTNGNIIAQLHCKVRAEAAEAQLQNQQQDRHQFTSSKTDSEGDSCGSYTFYNDLDYDEGPEQIQEMTEFAVDYDQK